MFLAFSFACAILLFISLLFYSHFYCLGYSRLFSSRPFNSFYTSPEWPEVLALVPFSIELSWFLPFYCLSLLSFAIFYRAKFYRSSPESPSTSTSWLVMIFILCLFIISVLIWRFESLLEDFERSFWLTLLVEESFTMMGASWLF